MLLFTHYHLLSVMSAYKQTKEKAGLKPHESDRGTLLTEQTRLWIFCTPFYELPSDDNSQNFSKAYKRLRCTLLSINMVQMFA